MSIFRTEPSSFLNKEDSFAWRGIMMIIIMILHFLYGLKYFYNIPIPGALGIDNWGCCTVGFFFLMAGYAFIKTIQSKLFLPYRYRFNSIIKLLSPFIVCAILYICIYSIYIQGGGIIIPLVDFSHRFQGCWFFKVIFLIYLYNYLIINRISLNKYLILTTILIGILALIMHIRGFGEFWYNSIFCYPIGCLIAYRNHTLTFFWSKNIIALRIQQLMSFTIILSLMIVGSGCHILRAPVFSVLSILLIPWVKFQNQWLIYIGRNSLLFYIFHVSWYALLLKYLHLPLLGFSVLYFLLPLLCVLAYKRLNDSKVLNVLKPSKTKT